MRSDEVKKGFDRALSTILDANRRLLKKGGTMIPQSGQIRVALIDNSREIFNSTSVASVHGFDLSKFNEGLIKLIH